MEQTPELEQVVLATARGQGRILFAEAAEPAEQMGIAAQLGEMEQLREIRLEIGEEAMGSHSIVSVGSRQSLARRSGGGGKSGPQHQPAPPRAVSSVAETLILGLPSHRRIDAGAPARMIEEHGLLQRA